MKKNVGILMILLLVSAFSYAQIKGTRQILDSAFIYFAMENYHDALPMFKKIEAADPNNANVNYHIGVCYLHMPSEKHNAIPYLEKVTDHVSKEYVDNPEEKNVPVRAFFELGTAYLLNYDLAKAIESTEKYKSFLDENVETDKNNRKQADRQIAMCHVAREMLKYPIPITVENLGAHVNTSYPEYSPAIVLDGNTLLFTSRRGVNVGDLIEDNGYYFEDVYMSKKSETSKWTEATNIATINTPDHEASISLSPDKKQLFIYKDDGGDGNIYVSNHNEKEWQTPKKLPVPINSKSWETHASLSSDGNTIFFTSDRKGGYGGLDIYKSEKKPDGKWGEALNLGGNINTEYNEDAPFLLYDKILYFCSQGHKTMGGYDIFYSRLKSDSSWAEPVNIGYPINTTDDDLFYTPVDSLTAYFASVRVQDSYGTPGFGDLDIYSLAIHPIMIRGTAYDKLTKKGLPGARITLMNDNMEVVEVAVTDSNGAFSFPADYNRNYNLKVTENSYEEATNTVSTFDVGDKKEIVADLAPEKIFVVSLKIHVDDASTNRPLEEVSVELMDVLTGIKEILTTDTNGNTYKSLNNKRYNDSLHYKLVFSKESYLSENTEFRYLITKPGEIVIPADLLSEKAQPVSMRIKVLDAKTNEPLKDVNIVLKDKETGVIENLITDNNGEVTKKLENKKINDSIKYDLVLSKESYVSKDVEYRYLILKPNEILVSETIGKMEVGTDLAKIIQIKNIYFDFDKYYIRPDAKVELDKIVKIMKEYPTIMVELGSHTDCRNTYAYNEVLSEKRAQSSVAYIVSKGIDRSRITGMGYGEYKLLTNCPCEGTAESECSEEEHQLNRRTEFRITGFIDGIGEVNIKSEKGTNIHTDPKPGKRLRNANDAQLKENYQQVSAEKSQTQGADNATANNDLVYRIQIMACDKDLDARDPFFKGLQDIYKYWHKGLYKYAWGKTTQLETAEELRIQMVETGFPDAFIVPFYKNRRITMEEVEMLDKK
ncbi:MAG TPA: carboxypeptidase regulatory-like domain-containing protein [Bacteroidales bacterium]|nr:carboxypeptidase regulatory-like domain-containing protein [Bacteroidales bacterium]